MGPVVQCSSCDHRLKEPKYLACSHIFCPECLEFPSISKLVSGCPTCRDAYQKQHDKTERLEENEFISRCCGNKQDIITCDSCGNNGALKFCSDCHCKYCSLCLVYHERFPVTSNHRLQLLKGTSVADRNRNYPECPEHLEVMNLYCEGCNTCVCTHCLTSQHNTHKMKHMSDYITSVRNRLENNIKVKEESIQTSMSNYQHACNALLECEKKAYALRDQVHQRGEEIKSCVDSLVVELDKTINRELKQHKKRTVEVMVELKNYEANVMTQIETLKKVMDNLNYANVVKVSSTISEEKEIVQKYSRDFNISLVYNNKCFKSKLEKIFGSLRMERNLRLVREDIFTDLVKSFASSQDNIFVSYWNEAKVDVFNLYGSLLKSSYNCKDVLSKIFDILAIDDNIYISGCCIADDTNIIKIAQICNATTSGRPLEIYSCPYQRDICRLSMSTCGNILFILHTKIMHLSKSRDVLKEINLTFSIFNGLQLDEEYYVVCGRHRELMIIDGSGKSIVKYSPSDECQEIKSPFALAKDIYGNIFVSDNFSSTKLFILDKDLNYKSSHVVNKYLHKISYDETRDVLLALPNYRELLTFDL